MTFKIDEGPSENIVYISAIGTISAEDYETLLLPLFAKFKKAGKKARILLHFGSDFSGYTLGAMWQDAKLGLSYMSAIERCAVVADATWLRYLTWAAGKLVCFPVKTYHEAQLAEAKAWINGDVTAEQS